MNPTFTLKILENYGCDDDIIHFARVSKNNAKILDFYIEKQMWHKCIEILSLQESVPLIPAAANKLISVAPVEFMNLCLKHVTLDPKAIIPHMIEYESIAGHRRQFIKYLEFSLSNVVYGCEKEVLDYLLYLYAIDLDSEKNEYEAGLFNFLKRFVGFKS